MMALRQLCFPLTLIITLSGVAARPPAVSSSMRDRAATLPNINHTISPREEEFPFLSYQGTPSGKVVQDGVKLRILPVGDSITVGFGNGADGSGYRERLRDNLSKNEVVFAGTEEDSNSDMEDGYFGAWSGKTIQYIADRIEPSLKQRPNLILLAAGTNDMNDDPDIAKEGNGWIAAAGRLYLMIEEMVFRCPDATILVSLIIPTCDNEEFHWQFERSKLFRPAVAEIVEEFRLRGNNVIAVDFSPFKQSDLRDCVHPTDQGYKLMGDWWYDFIHQIPEDWIEDPVGPDPERDDSTDANGGIDDSIPPPDWGNNPLQAKDPQEIGDAVQWIDHPETWDSCKDQDLFSEVGKIALGNVGHNGDWKYHRNWQISTDDKWGGNGKVADGLGLDEAYVRLHDMDGDGKADYIWIHPQTGEIRCWINNLPDHWTPAGNNGGIIGSGVKGSKYIYLADMNGDGLDDYLVVDPSNGSVRVWWNYGPDDSWDNGWKFVEGGEIATGVPHANLATLRFPDINGDGRADYVYIGKGGSLKHHMNTGTQGGTDVLFRAMEGIATGAVSDISKLIFADINGDGRDDYLIWDDDGGLTGFLNQRTFKEGVPVYINQGKAKTIAEGVHQKPSAIRLADMDGDGKADYVRVGDNGALFLWYNRGTTDDAMTGDGVHFADIDGDGADDYVWVDPKDGSPVIYLNGGSSKTDSLGWEWNPVNGAKPHSIPGGPHSHVLFGHMNNNKRADYVAIDTEEQKLRLYLNAGEDGDSYRFKSGGVVTIGSADPKNIRLADIDGDGFWDCIILFEGGRAEIYRNVIGEGSSDWYNLGDYEPSGIGRPPAEIQFIDMDGDGKADYVWTEPITGSVKVWLNNYPNLPAWLEVGEVTKGAGTSGANVQFVRLRPMKNYQYVVVDPNTGALGAWFNRQSACICVKEDDHVSEDLQCGSRGPIW